MTNQVNNLVNRYGAATPTSYTDTGLAISCPIYLSLTPEQAKALLNGFREVRRKQLLELGHKEVRTSDNLMVITSSDCPQTEIERQSGFNEDSLRAVIFGRNGVSERIILKLQRLTGVYVVTKEQLMAAQETWITALYDEYSLSQTASTTSKVGEPRKEHLSRQKPKNLRQILIDKYGSQAQAAVALQIDPSELSKFINGKATPSASTMARIYTALDL